LPQDYGNAICISSQVGCNQGCSFCASAMGGKVRDLTPGEMLGQVLLLRSLLPPEKEQRISHLVLMGMGEPLDNLDQVLKLLEISNAPWGMGIGFRHITLSTCGIIPGIDRLSKLKLPINLAISLHAADDDLRRRLMPKVHRYALTELISAAGRFSSATGRRVTYEYGLMDGVNDSAEQAGKLAGLLRGTLSHVNLIPYNSWNTALVSPGYSRSRVEATKLFADTLRSKGIETTIRREMGMDIAAACGQLRSSG